MADTAEQKQELARSVVDHMVENDAFSRWLGIELLSLEPGKCSVKMTVRPEMVNGFGVSHGGIVFSLADSAFAFAANSHGRLSVALDNNITYPAKVVVGDVLTAKAEELATTNKTGSYQVLVHNQDEVLVAIFRGTVYRTPKLFFPDQAG